MNMDRAQALITDLTAERDQARADAHALAADVVRRFGARNPITGEWFCEFLPAATPLVQHAARVLGEAAAQSARTRA